MFGLLELIDPRAAKPYHTRTSNEQSEISKTAACLDATTLVLCSLIIMSASQYTYDLFNHPHLIIPGISGSVGVLSFLISQWTHNRQYLAAMERNKALISAEGGMSQGQATMIYELQLGGGASSCTNQLLTAAHIGLDIIGRNDSKKRD